MPVDSSIAMGYQPLKLENPMNSLAQMMQIQGVQKQNQLADLSMQQHQIAADRQNKLYSILGTLPKDATDDQRSSALKGGGFFDEADKLDTGILNRRKIESEAQGKDVESEGKTVLMYRDLIGMAQDPQTAAVYLERMHTDPRMKNTPVARLPLDASIAQIGQDPESFNKWKQQFALGASKFIEQNKPSIHTVDSGQVSTMYAVPGLGGAPTALNTTQKVATPDAVMTDTRTRDEGKANRSQALNLANQAVTYQDDGNGNLVALPSKVAPGTAIKPISVLDANGNPLQSNKSNLNGDQSKAALYGSRMKQSDAILAELADKGVTTSNLGSSLGMGMGAAVTALSSSDKQRLDQAKRNFINATLRRESGAAIAPSEFDNAEKQYFPQIGDSAEVKAQKADNRASAINGMLIEIPKGQRDKVVTDILGDKGKPKPDNSGLPPDVAAALAKHGAK